MISGSSTRRSRNGASSTATRGQFKAKLAERLTNPRVPAAKLGGHKDRYKIKLRSAGYRLVYEVRDRELIVVVVAVGKRERNAVYGGSQATGPRGWMRN